MGKNRNKKFINQISLEIKKLFGSKFFLIVIALLLSGSVLFPILSKIQSNNNFYHYILGVEDIVVDGQVISRNIPSYWDIYEINKQLQHLTENATNKVDDLAIEYMETVLKGLLKISKHMIANEDYRIDLIFIYRDNIVNKFKLEHLNINEEDLDAVILYDGPIQIIATPDNYYDLTEKEKIAKMESIDKTLSKIENIFINNDYKEYYSYKLERLKKAYKDNLKEIEQLENDIIEYPQNEDTYNSLIEYKRDHIQRTIIIDMQFYEYLLENDVAPSTSDWREVAQNNKKSALYNIMDYKILPQAEFEADEYLRQDYINYNDYKDNMQKMINKNIEKLYIAEKSLETGKPDMAYITDGTRKKVVGFLWYSILIAVFGAIIGGGIIAKEFQTGTIRLLLIRPKTRIKIVLSKLCALLIINFALYGVSVILNILTNGILFGFSDLSYPNYTISSKTGESSFFIYYTPKFLICFISIFFACSLAYFLSIITKNTAVSVAIPLVCFAGSLITMPIIQYSIKSNWIQYTPLPYVNLAMYYITDQTNNNFTPVLGLGVPMMIVFSLVLIILGTNIFNKKEI